MKYFFLLVIVILFGCHHPRESSLQNNKAVKKDSAKLNRAARRMKLEKEWHLDSLKDESVINDAIAYIKSNKLAKASKQLRLWKDTSISVHIRLGKLFSKNLSHLILRSHVDWRMILYIYRIEPTGKMIREIRDDWSDLTYIGDKVADINGDEVNDFVINWYPSSGCCARNNFHVYLYQKDNTFSNYFDFINPSFSPKEKLVRGVDYGHPGEVPLYKFKWNGVKLDTLEYIYPADTLKKKFYLVHHYGDADDPQKRKTLSAVPKEYLKINGYSWFIDY
jgi:hypothetical protein